jgi:hypothetical protein
MFAQINAATTATSRMPALPDSVRKNARSGAARFRAHAVRPRQSGPDADESAMHVHEAEAYETIEGNRPTHVRASVPPCRPSQTVVHGAAAHGEGLCVGLVEQGLGLVWVDA